MRSILVAYDTKNGSTAEVASVIARRLGEHGLQVTTMAARDVRNAGEFDSLVIGAPLYSGRWLSGAHRLVKRVSKMPAAARPQLALFALGPRVDEGPESWMRPRAQFERAIGKHPDATPVATALFGGADPPRKSPRRDIRDWDRIAAWADEVAGLLARPRGSVG